MAKIPDILPSTLTRIAVFPCSSNPDALDRTSSESSIPLSRKIILFPVMISFPRTLAITPFPGVASNSFASSISMPSPRAFLTTASARGCSEFFSAEAASIKSSLSSTPKTTISVTSGLPTVRVPVLSKATAFSLSAASRASPLFMRIPSSAPLPIPTVTAVGVAKPRAHGHAITNTDIRAVREKRSVFLAIRYQ